MNFLLKLITTVGLVTFFTAAAPTNSIVIPKMTTTIDNSTGIAPGLVGAGDRFSATHASLPGLLVCKSSPASPTISEIDGLIDLLKVKTLCRQGNAIGSLCTKLVSFHGGDVSLCGEWKHWMHCSDVAWCVAFIRDNCAPINGRVGGLFSLQGKPMRVVIH